MRNVEVDEGKIELGPGFDEIGSTMVLRGIEGIYPYNQENGEKNFPKLTLWLSRMITMIILTIHQY